VSAKPTPDSLLAANERFYRAFEALDYPAMAALWAEGEEVFCVHPGWSGLRGAGPVLESWRRIIANTASIQFTLTQVKAVVVGEVGVVTLYENIASQVAGEPHTATTVATNVFRFDARAGAWKLFHHHASPASLPGEPREGMLN